MSLEVNINNQIKRPNPKFTLEFKQDATKLVNEKGYTHQQAADNLGISLSAIGRWVKGRTRPHNPISHIYQVSCFTCANFKLCFCKYDFYE
jgi:Helix-turn-helix